MSHVYSKVNADKQLKFSDIITKPTITLITLQINCSLGSGQMIEEKINSLHTLLMTLKFSFEFFSIFKLHFSILERKKSLRIKFPSIVY